MKIYITIVLIVANLGQSGKVIDNWKARRSSKIRTNMPTTVIFETINSTEADRQCVAKKKNISKTSPTYKLYRAGVIQNFFYNPTETQSKFSVLRDPAVKSKYIFNDDWFKCDEIMDESKESRFVVDVKNKRDLSDSVDACQMIRTLGKPTYPKNRKDQLLLDLRAKLPIKNSKFCGLKFNNRELEIYEIQTFNSIKSMKKSGFTLTHTGRCGMCSTLIDFRIYLTKDLTVEARRCGMKFLFSDMLTEKCFRNEIGFTPGCAKAWRWNTRNTKKLCFKECITMFFKGKNNVGDGKLHECLQCDEDFSGPGFKFYAGRTRRNSGLVSEINRKYEVEGSQAGSTETINHRCY